MSKNLIAIFIVLFTSINIAEGQRLILIDKDARISKYQEQLVKYLIEKRQLEQVKPVFKIADYRGKLYIYNCLEFYKNQSYNLMLVKFGNLDSHGWTCWALLGSRQINIFMDTKGEEFKKLAEGNQPVITSTIKTFVDAMGQ